MDVRDQVYVFKAHEFGTLDPFPGHEHQQHDRELNVEAHERDTVKGRTEAFPALDKNKEAVQHNGDPWTNRIRPVLEREEMGLALHLEGRSESNGGYADGDPAELVGNSDEADGKLLLVCLITSTRHDPQETFSRERAQLTSATMSTADLLQ